LFLLLLWNSTLYVSKFALKSMVVLSTPENKNSIIRECLFLMVILVPGGPQ